VNDYARESFAARLQCNPDKLPLNYAILAGSTAGFCQVVVTNPMEMVKIQMQLAGPGNTSLGALVRQLGIRGLYKSTTATLCRDVPFSVIFFPSVAIFKQALAPGCDSGEAPLSATFGSGILAGALAAFVVTPADVVKTRLQAKGSIYTGMAHCYRDIIATEGPRALFKVNPPWCGNDR
jgi:hypothetical protein